MRRRLLSSVWSIALGWATLFLILYLLERPLLDWAGGLLGAGWFPTIRLALDCAALAATGFIIGRMNRPGDLLEILVFAATLALWDFGGLLTLNVPWLFRLALDTAGNMRYLNSLAAAAASHAVLFGSLIAGRSFSRSAPAKAVSLLGARPR